MSDSENSMERARDRLLAAALPHVAFDGWSERTLAAAIADSATPPGLARALFPRGGVDLAVAWHRQGDRRMAEALAGQDLTGLKFRDRVTRAVRLRLELAGPREAVRRSSSLFGLPNHMAEGAALIWGTADAIWRALDDSSRDINWYSKRAVLSAVYASTLLFWLGDDSEGQLETWAFLDRRIENVMQFEKAKAGFRENRLGKALLSGPLKVLERVHAPEPRKDLPGRVTR
jgi:ubiquinone biosynthesis protein COQ9